MKNPVRPRIPTRRSDSTKVVGWLILIFAAVVLAGYTAHWLAEPIARWWAK